MNENVYKILNKVFLFLPFLILINIIFSVFTTNPDSFSKLETYSFPYLLTSIIIALLPWLFFAGRIKIWTDFLGYKIPYWEAIRIVIGSDLGAAISPTAVGGSPVRAAMLVSDGVKLEDSVFMAIVATIEDVTYLVITFFLMILTINYFEFKSLDVLLSFKYTLETAYYVTGITFILYLIYRFILKRFKLSKKIYLWLKTFFTEVKIVFKYVIKNGLRIFIYSYLLNILQWTARYVIIFTLLKGLGIHQSLIETIVLAWLVYFSILFVPTPGAVLGAEAAFYLIFSLLLTDKMIGLVTIGWRFLTFYFQLTVGALLFLIIGYFTSKKMSLYS